MFNKISVREDSGVKLCKDFLGVEAQHVLDPTLLLNKNNYMSLIKKSYDGNRTLFSYVLDKSEDKIEFVEFMAKEKGLKIVTCMSEDKLIPGVTKDFSKCIYPSVDKWLNGFNNAEFVVTDSFHGTVFAIIFNKQFVTIGNERRGMARFESLLKMFGLEDRLVTDFVDIVPLLSRQINFNHVNKLIEKYKIESIKFLENIC